MRKDYCANSLPRSIAVNDDPLRMYFVIRRGAFADLARAGELTGAAAVRCVSQFADDPQLEQWRPRPGKVVLRARGGQWGDLLDDERHVLAGDPDGECVVALAPRRRSERGPLLERMQAMTSDLAPPPDEPDGRAPVAYLVNPAIEMSSGKTLAQIAHAAVLAADTGTLGDWVAAGCPAEVISPPRARFDELCSAPGLLARVEDAGLTEVPPGTVTVIAISQE
jgi:hypothetical protein